MRLESGRAGGGMTSRREQLFAVVPGDFQLNDRAGFGRRGKPHLRKLLGTTVLLGLNKHAA